MVMPRLRLPLLAASLLLLAVLASATQVNVWASSKIVPDDHDTGTIVANNKNRVESVQRLQPKDDYKSRIELMTQRAQGIHEKAMKQDQVELNQEQEVKRKEDEELDKRDEQDEKEFEKQLQGDVSQQAAKAKEQTAKVKETYEKLKSEDAAEFSKDLTSITKAAKQRQADLEAAETQWRNALAAREKAEQQARDQRAQEATNKDVAAKQAEFKKEQDGKAEAAAKQKAEADAKNNAKIAAQRQQEELTKKQTTVSWVQLGHTCFSGRSGYGSVSLKGKRNIRGLRLHWTSGKVTCNNSQYSFWGCDPNWNFISVVIANAANTIIAPNPNNKGFKASGTGPEKCWYNIEGGGPNVEVLNWIVPDNQWLYQSQGDEALRVYYGEAYFGWTTGDNNGQTCAYVYALMTVAL